MHPTAVMGLALALGAALALAVVEDRAPRSSGPLRAAPVVLAISSGADLVLAGGAVAAGAGRTLACNSVLHMAGLSVGFDCGEPARIAQVAGRI